MSDALASYREAVAATEQLAREKVFDLRVRMARVDDALFLLKNELTRCRVSSENRRRSTVPNLDLCEAISYLKNHRSQLENAESRALEAVL